MIGDFPVNQQALVIFDCLRGQITECFLDVLKENPVCNIPPLLHRKTAANGSQCE